MVEMTEQSKEAQTNLVAEKLFEEGKSRVWVPLTLSYVQYPQGDVLGGLLALSSLGPMTLLTGFIPVIFFQRNIFIICFYFGFLLNEPLNQFMKRVVFRQVRPYQNRNQFGNYGMPSSHAQHSWFFVVFCILLFIIRMPEYLSWECWMLMLLLIVGASIVSYGRIYLEYHTCAQVIVGGLVGSTTAGLWFLLVHFILTQWFPSITSWYEHNNLRYNS